MALLIAQNIVQTGLAPVLALASVTGDQFTYKTNRFLLVNNADVLPMNVTVNSVELCSQGFDHDDVVTVAAGTQKMVGPFALRFVDPSSIVSITYSSITSVSVAILELPAPI